jgi:alpha-2-macroglobulin
MRAFLSVLLLWFISAFPLAAQDGPIPERRLILAEDTDFYGSDIAQLFDTTLAACQRACLSDPDCRAFTFNSRTNACFPKTEAGRIEPYEGATSAWVRDSDAGVLARAAERRDELGFLTSLDIALARTQAEELATRHVTGTWTETALMDEALRARQQNNPIRAAHYFGAALNITDSAEVWLDYGRALLEVRVQDFVAQRDFRQRALLAAVNGYLRAEAAGLRASAAVLLAEALEINGRGRDMIPALRLAQSLQAREDTAAMLDEAIGKYGFRVTDHRVESEPAQARICAVFSEALAEGVDFAPFVQLAAQGLSVEPDGRQLCVDGVQHGQRYSLTLREGLPAASGEILARSVTLNLYVRDRAPLVRFPGRAYVLPAAGEIALPVETVNTDRLDLVLRRVSDRNLIRSDAGGDFRPAHGGLAGRTVRRRHGRGGLARQRRGGDGPQPRHDLAPAAGRSGGRAGGRHLCAARRHPGGRPLGHAGGDAVVRGQRSGHHLDERRRRVARGGAQPRRRRRQARG